jgi:hypothetical protein
MAIVFVTALFGRIWKRFLKSSVRRYTIEEKLCTFILQLATVLPQVAPPADRQAGYIGAMRTKGSDLKKAVFVPLTDDILYEHPERVLGPVIPFSQSARPAAVESTPFIPVRSDLNVETGLKTSAAAVMKRFKAG